jgi:hypothetical protein
MPISISPTVKFPEAGPLGQAAGLATHTGALVSVREDGWLVVQLDDANQLACLWLDTGSLGPRPLQAGDVVLVLVPPSGRPPVVLGRIGAYQPTPQPQPTVTIEATESLTLKCGEASVDLRADGKVMVRGEDVLLRAKGTQRIRAGNVAIN